MHSPAVYDPKARLALARRRVEAFERARTRIGQKVGYMSTAYQMALKAVKSARLELDAAIEENLE